MTVDPHSVVPTRRDIRRIAMTAGWIVINIALMVVVSTIVAGTAVLVPHMLHRHAMHHDYAYARRHHELNVGVVRGAPQQRRAGTERHRQAA